MTIEASRAAFERACRNHHGQDMAQRRYALAVARGIQAELDARAKQKRGGRSRKIVGVMRKLFYHYGKIALAIMGKHR